MSNFLSGYFGGLPISQGPEYLYNIPKMDIFDYSIGLNPEDNTRLIELFYLRYGNRQIGYDSIQTFKNQVKAHYYMIWPRYRKLYATINAIQNPFATKDLKSNYEETYDDQSKKSETNNSRSETSGVDKHDDYGTKTYAQGNKEKGYSANNLKTSRQSDSQNAEAESNTNTTLYSDSPQSGVVSNGSSGSEKVPTLFNEGYVTTTTLVTNAENKSGATTVGETGNEKNDSVDGRNSTIDYNDSTANTGGAENYQESTNLGRRESTKGEQGGRQNKNNETGFDGVSVSRLLQEYRETCLPIDLDFISEFDVFFYGILRS